MATGQINILVVAEPQFLFRNLFLFEVCLIFSLTLRSISQWSSPTLGASYWALLLDLFVEQVGF